MQFKTLQEFKDSKIYEYLASLTPQQRYNALFDDS